MTTISIIKTTNHPMGNRVFAGVYGTRQETPAAAENERPTSQFTIAPEFRNVSQLFTYLENGTSEVQPGEIIDLEVPDEQASTIRNQLLFALKNRWKDMYASLLGQRSSDMLSTMRQGESRVVDSAIEARFASFGLRPWSVPVTATVRLQEEGYGLADEQALLDRLKYGRPQQVVVTEGEPVVTVAARADAAANMVQTEALAIAGDTATTEAAPSTPEWHGFAGIDADIKGYVVVVAESEAAARLAANAMIDLSTRNTEVFSVKVEPSEVLATRQAVYADHVTDAMDSDHDGDDDESDDSHRSHYQF